MSPDGFGKSRPQEDVLLKYPTALVTWENVLCFVGMDNISANSKAAEDENLDWDGNIFLLAGCCSSVFSTVSCFSSVFSASLSSWYVLRTSSWLCTCFSILFWHKVAVLIPFGIVPAQEGRKIHFQASNICLFSLTVVFSIYTVVVFLLLWWWNLNSCLRGERFQGVENTKTE